MDTKLVAETVVTEELGEYVSAAIRRQMHFGQKFSDLYGIGQWLT
jgi:hypothetical protein